MSAMENMVRTLLKAMNLDVDTVKAEVTSRIKLFEENLDTLNSTLISIHQRQASIEANLKALMNAQNLEWITTATEKGKPNGSDNRGSVPTITG